MKKTKLIIWILVLSSLVIGLSVLRSSIINNYNEKKIINQDEYYWYLKDGTKICKVEQTKLFFENKTGYMFSEINSYLFRYKLNNTWNDDSSIIIYPEQNIKICREQGDWSRGCIGEIKNLSIGCSWCYRITEKWELIDEGIGCLSGTEIFLIDRSYPEHLIN